MVRWTDSSCDDEEEGGEEEAPAEESEEEEEAEDDYDSLRAQLDAAFKKKHAALEALEKFMDAHPEMKYVKHQLAYAEDAYHGANMKLHKLSRSAIENCIALRGADTKAAA